MAFVNEYISNEDVKKYELEKIWDSFRPPFEKGGYNEPGFRFTWTVDRDRNTFFMPVHTGREENSSQSTCVLWSDGIQVIATLNRGSESTSNIKDGTGHVVWQLKHLHRPPNANLDETNIINLLKEALIAYGYRGIWRTLPHFTVNFEF